MAKRRPTTIAEYIRAAPKEGQPHLRRLHKLLKGAAPHAEAVIKWNAPFFVDPHFVYAWSAFRAHCVFAPTAGALREFKDELRGYQTTKHYLKLPYDQPLPEKLILKIAKWRIRNLGLRDSFW